MFVRELLTLELMHCSCSCSSPRNGAAGPRLQAMEKHSSTLKGCVTALVHHVYIVWRRMVTQTPLSPPLPPLPRSTHFAWHTHPEARTDPAL